VDTWMRASSSIGWLAVYVWWEHTGRCRTAWRRWSRQRRRRRGKSASGSSATSTTSRRWVLQPHMVHRLGFFCCLRHWLRYWIASTHINFVQITKRKSRVECHRHGERCTARTSSCVIKRFHCQTARKCWRLTPHELTFIPFLDLIWFLCCLYHHIIQY